MGYSGGSGVIPSPRSTALPHPDNLAPAQPQGRLPQSRTHTLLRAHSRARVLLDLQSRAKAQNHTLDETVFAGPSASATRIATVALTCLRTSSKRDALRKVEDCLRVVLALGGDETLDVRRVVGALPTTERRVDEVLVGLTIGVLA
jgi:hypothetical protein